MSAFLPSFMKKKTVSPTGPRVLGNPWKNKFGKEYLSMSMDQKRQLYLCGDKYHILSDVPVWPEMFYTALEHINTRSIRSPDPKGMASFPVNNDINSKISVWQGDITTLEIDAIVNAGDSTLLGSSSFFSSSATVNNCIHKAAGPTLNEECLLLKGCEVGEAKITSGHKLPAKYIIHTVGSWYGMQGHPLVDSYKNILDLVLKFGIKSVAFCCISTGGHGFPRRTAADCALRYVRVWLEDHHHEIDRIIFCTYEDANFKIYKELMASIYFPCEKEVPCLEGLKVCSKEAQEHDDELIKSPDFVQSTTNASRSQVVVCEDRADVAQHDLQRDLEKLCECPVCLERVEAPRTLKCGHTFCRECLEELVKFGVDSCAEVQCPACMGVHKFARNESVGQLSASLAFRQMISLLKPVRVQQSLAKCSRCGGKMVELKLCLDCKELYCKSCSNAVHRDSRCRPVLDVGFRDDNLFVVCPEHLCFCRFMCSICRQYLCHYCTQVHDDAHRQWISPIHGMYHTLRGALDKVNKIILSYEALPERISNCGVAERAPLIAEVRRQKASALLQMAYLLDVQERHILETFDELVRAYQEAAHVQAEKFRALLDANKDKLSRAHELERKSPAELLLYRPEIADLTEAILGSASGSGCSRPLLPEFRFSLTRGAGVSCLADVPASCKSFLGVFRGSLDAGDDLVDLPLQKFISSADFEEVRTRTAGLDLRDTSTRLREYLESLEVEISSDDCGVRGSLSPSYPATDQGANQSSSDSQALVSDGIDMLPPCTDDFKSLFVDGSDVSCSSTSLNTQR